MVCAKGMVIIWTKVNDARLTIRHSALQVDLWDAIQCMLWYFVYCLAA